MSPLEQLSRGMYKLTKHVSVGILQITQRMQLFALFPLMFIVDIGGHGKQQVEVWVEITSCADCNMMNTLPSSSPRQVILKEKVSSCKCVYWTRTISARATTTLKTSSGDSHNQTEIFSPPITGRCFRIVCLLATELFSCERFSPNP